MLLKRLFPDDIGEEARAIRDLLESPSADHAALRERLAHLSTKVDSVRIQRLSKRWNVGPRIVQKGAAEGWLSIVDGHIVLKGEDGPVRFKINAAPTATEHYYATEHVAEEA